MSDLYRNLREIGYEEAELERKIICDGMTLEEIMQEAINDGFEFCGDVETPAAG